MQTVIVNAIPAAPTASSYEVCQNAASPILTATGSNLKWYGTNATGGTASSTAPVPSTSTVGTTNYYVTQTVNGCESPRRAVPVTVNPLPSVTANVGSITCNGAATGTIVSTSSGGTPAYTYSKDGTNFQSGNIFTGIAAGTYTITIKDSKGCIGTTNVVVPSSNPLTLSASAENECIAGNNGKVTANGGGGTAPLSYNIDGGAYGASNVFTGLAAGSHTVGLKDANNCEITTTITVANVTNPTVSVATKTDCIVGSTGQVTLSVSGGSPTYTYSKDGSNFQSSEVFAGLSAGTYTFTVKDSRGCTSTVSATINNKPSPPSVTSSYSYCQNATPSALSATGSNLLWYSASSGGIGSSTTPTVSTSSAGSTNYYVSQTVNGCESDRSVIVVNVSPTVSISLAKTDACNSLNNGTVTATVSGGTSPFTYKLNSGSATSANVFTDLAAGNYPVEVTDANGCMASSTITVSTSPALTITATSTPTCAEVGGASITVTPTGGTGTIQYKLNSGDYQASNTFSGQNPGTFTVYAKDANSCETSTTITVKPKPFLTASNTCIAGGQIGLSALDAGTGATYAWTGPNSYTSTDQNPTINQTSDAQKGTYTVTVTLDGCTNTATTEVTCATVLPVKLINFAGYQFKSDNIIYWSTSEMVNFDRFELQQSRNAVSFEKIYEVKAPSNHSRELNYQFIDTRPFEGITYYRLKMIDLDGTFEYSKIIAINFEKEGEYVAIENPIQKDEINILTNIKQPSVRLINVLGQDLPFTQSQTNEGYKIRPNRTSSNLLFLQIQGEKYNKTHRLIFIR